MIFFFSFIRYDGLFLCEPKEIETGEKDSAQKEKKKKINSSFFLFFTQLLNLVMFSFFQYFTSTNHSSLRDLSSGMDNPNSF